MDLSISPKDIKEEMMHQLRALNKAKLGPNSPLISKYWTNF